jgi:hypothetical protein
VEPIERIDLIPIPSNPGGPLTIWQNNSNGHTYIGNTDLTQGGDFAEINFDTFVSGGPSYSQALALQGTFYELANTTQSLFTNNGLAWSNSPLAYRLYYNGPVSKVMRVNFTVTLGTTVAPQNVAIQVEENANGITLISPSRFYGTTSTTLDTTINGFLFVTMVPTSFISLFIACTSAAAVTIAVQESSLSAQ